MNPSVRAVRDITMEGDLLKLLGFTQSEESVSSSMSKWMDGRTDGW